jgi:hypothetical protein
VKLSPHTGYLRAKISTFGKEKKNSRNFNDCMAQNLPDKVPGIKVLQKLLLYESLIKPVGVLFYGITPCL